MKNIATNMQKETGAEPEDACKKKKPQKRLNKKTVAAGILLVIMIFTGSVYKTYRNGFGLMVQNTDIYRYNAQEVSAQADFQVSLEDLKSSAGLSVYDDGTCKIQLVSVAKVENGYTLSFEAKPSYDFFQNHAVLVSAAKEEYLMTGNGMAHFAAFAAKLSDISENGKAKITNGDVNDVGTFFSYCVVPAQGETTLFLRFTGLQRQNWDIK